MLVRIMDDITLKGYFEANGFEVVDMRPKGGCLWVIGERDVLAPYTKQVAEQYQAEGRFAQGKATKYRNGWFTKSSR